MTPEKRKEYEDFFDKYFSELKYDHALIYKYENMNAEEIEFKLKEKNNASDK